MRTPTPDSEAYAWHRAALAGDEPALTRIAPDPACPHCHGRGGYSIEKDYGFDRVSEWWRHCSCTNPLVREITDRRRRDASA